MFLLNLIIKNHKYNKGLNYVLLTRMRGVSVFWSTWCSAVCECSDGDCGEQSEQGRRRGRVRRGGGGGRGASCASHAARHLGGGTRFFRSLEPVRLRWPFSTVSNRARTALLVQLMQLPCCGGPHSPLNLCAHPQIFIWLSKRGARSTERFIAFAPTKLPLGGRFMEQILKQTFVV